jgi:hypothetical protein
MRIMKAECFEGPVVHYQGEDGFPVGMIIPVLIVWDSNNNIYQLPNPITVKYDEDMCYRILHFTLEKGKELIEKIMLKGVINPDLWVKINWDDLKEYLSGSYGFVNSFSE